MTFRNGRAGGLRAAGGLSLFRIVCEAQRRYRDLPLTTDPNDVMQPPAGRRRPGPYPRR